MKPPEDNASGHPGEDDPARPPDPIEEPDAEETGEHDDFEADLERRAAEEAARAAAPGGETEEFDVAADAEDGAAEDEDASAPHERKTIVIRPGTVAGRAAAATPEEPSASKGAQPAGTGVEDEESGGAEPAGPSQPVTATSPQLTPAEGGIPPGMVVPPNYEQTQVSEDEIHRPRLWIRFLIASAVIFVSFAAATSTTVLLYLQDIARKLGSDPALAGAIDVLSHVKADDPQTILLVGSDRRYGDQSKGIPSRSDTVILVRLDPDRGAIATLRLPRDLRVDIPGVGREKLNAAYANGGPTKTLQTVKQYLGIPIHHIVNVSFRGFREAVDAIDCVYVDVDRRYYHSNEGLPPSQHYAEIDLKPGYQKLCGRKGLDFVRYRHEDNDLVRGARQQEFLRQARQKIGPERLLRDRDELLKIFTRNTSSDIDDAITMLEVLKLFVASRGSAIREVNLKVKIGEIFVSAKPESVERAKRQLLGLRGSTGPRGTSAAPEASRRPATRQRDRRRGGDQTAGARLYSAVGAARAQRIAAQPKLAFPVYAPNRLERGSQYVDQPRTYDLHSPGGKKHRAYKMVVRTYLREYYGVMGTDWRDPPILNNPTRRIRLGGRNFMVFSGTENRPRMVAWRTRNAAYWVSNTLRGALTRAEMLAIARSARASTG